MTEWLVQGKLSPEFSSETLFIGEKTDAAFSWDVSPTHADPFFEVQSVIMTAEGSAAKQPGLVVSKTL